MKKSLKIASGVMLTFFVCVAIAYLVYGGIKHKWNPFTGKYWKSSGKVVITFDSEGYLVVKGSETFVDYNVLIKNSYDFIEATEEQRNDNDFIDKMLRCGLNSKESGLSCDFAQPVQFWFHKDKMRASFQGSDDAFLITKRYGKFEDLRSQGWTLIDTYEQLVESWNLMRTLPVAESVRAKLRETYSFATRRIEYKGRVTVHIDSGVPGGTSGILPGKEISWAEFFLYAVHERILFGECPEMELGALRGPMKLPSARDMYRQQMRKTYDR